MAPEKAILSPPLSGRTSKAQEPRIASAGVIVAHSALNAACRFSADAARLSGKAAVGNGAHRCLDDAAAVLDVNGANSPGSGKKRGSSMSKAEHRMLTPPLSRDTRMDGGKDDTPESRSMSDGELESHTGGSGHDTHRDRQSELHEAVQQTVIGRKRQKGPVAAADSDDEENPFMVRQASSASSSARYQQPLGQTRTSYAEPDDEEELGEQDGYDEEDQQMLEMSDEEQEEAATMMEEDGAGDLTPRQARLATTRPAAPMWDNVLVESQDVSMIHPIRDTPMNPFLEGGPADSGLDGPRAGQARMRARMFPGKEKGKITYVFRGQRVVYADPEYDSDDSDEAMYQRTGQRPPRLQPKLLFPSSASAAGSSSKAGLSSSASRSSFSSNTATTTPASSNAGPSKPCAGGGLFAAEIAARESAKRKAQAPSASSSEWRDEVGASAAATRLQSMTGSSIEQERESRATSHAEARRPIQGNGRLPPPTTTAAAAARTRDAAASHMSQRNALLARLDEAEWSEDDAESRGGDEDAEPEFGAALTAPEELASKRARLDEDGSSHVDDCAQSPEDIDADAEGEDDVDYGRDGPTQAATVAQRGGGLMSAFQEARGGGGEAQAHGRGLAQRMKRRYA